MLERGQVRREVRPIRTTTTGLTVLIASVSVTAALARPPNLDQSFGRGGKVLTPINSGICKCDAGDIVTEMLSLGHGRVLAAGTSRGDVALARYKASGKLDRSFSEDGKVSIHAEAPDDQKLTTVGLERQADGKIVVAAEDYFVARLRRDGSLDKSFGGDGLEHVFFKRGLSDIAIQPNGRIVVAGTRDLFRGYAPEFRRLLPNGRLDRSFGHGGSVTVRSRRGFTSVQRIKLQDDGKIVGVGDTDQFPHRDQGFYAVRLDRSGRVDRGFGRGGIVKTRAASGAFAEDFAFQPDGKMVVVGDAFKFFPKQDSYVDRFVLARYLPDGQLDRSFGDHGVVTTQRRDAFGAAVALRGGRIYLAGHGRRKGGNPSFTLLRYRSNGSLDLHFGRAGALFLPLGKSAGANAILTQPSGRLLLGGFAHPRDHPSRFALLRLNEER